MTIEGGFDNIKVGGRQVDPCGIDFGDIHIDLRDLKKLPPLPSKKGHPHWQVYAVLGFTGSMTALTFLGNVPFSAVQRCFAEGQTESVPADFLPGLPSIDTSINTIPPSPTPPPIPASKCVVPDTGPTCVSKDGKTKRQAPPAAFCYGQWLFLMELEHRIWCGYEGGKWVLHDEYRPPNATVAASHEWPPYPDTVGNLEKAIGGGVQQASQTAGQASGTTQDAVATLGCLGILVLGGIGLVKAIT